MTCSRNSAEDCVGSDAAVLCVEFGGDLSTADGVISGGLLSAGDLQIQESIGDDDV